MPRGIKNTTNGEASINETITEATKEEMITPPKYLVEFFESEIKPSRITALIVLTNNMSFNVGKRWDIEQDWKSARKISQIVKQDNGYSVIDQDGKEIICIENASVGVVYEDVSATV